MKAKARVLRAYSKVAGFIFEPTCLQKNLWPRKAFGHLSHTLKYLNVNALDNKISQQVAFKKMRVQEKHFKRLLLGFKW